MTENCWSRSVFICWTSAEVHCKNVLCLPIPSSTVLVLELPQVQAAAVCSFSISEIQKGWNVTGLASVRSGNNGGV